MNPLNHSIPVSERFPQERSSPIYPISGRPGFAAPSFTAPEIAVCSIAVPVMVAGAIRAAPRVHGVISHYNPAYAAKILARGASSSLQLRNVQPLLRSCRSLAPRMKMAASTPISPACARMISCAEYVGIGAGMVTSSMMGKDSDDISEREVCRVINKNLVRPYRARCDEQRATLQKEKEKLEGMVSDRIAREPDAGKAQEFKLAGEKMSKKMAAFDQELKQAGETVTEHEVICVELETVLECGKEALVTAGSLFLQSKLSPLGNIAKVIPVIVGASALIMAKGKTASLSDVSRQIAEAEGKLKLETPKDSAQGFQDEFAARVFLGAISECVDPGTSMGRVALKVAAGLGVMKAQPSSVARKDLDRCVADTYERSESELRSTAEKALSAVLKTQRIVSNGASSSSSSPA